MSSDFQFNATSKSADAPDVEAGFYDATFDGIDKKFIKGGTYGDGDRFEWSFGLLDDDGAALYDEGDPIVVTGLTSMSTNILSKTQPRAVRYLKALMTPVEFAGFENGKGPMASELLGRKAQVEVYINDNGWPGISNVLPLRKARKARSSASSNDAD